MYNSPIKNNKLLHEAYLKGYRRALNEQYSGVGQVPATLSQYSPTSDWTPPPFAGLPKQPNLGVAAPGTKPIDWKGWFTHQPGGSVLMQLLETLFGSSPLGWLGFWVQGAGQFDFPWDQYGMQAGGDVNGDGIPDSYYYLSDDGSGWGPGIILTWNAEANTWMPQLIQT